MSLMHLGVALGGPILTAAAFRLRGDAAWSRWGLPGNLAKLLFGGAMAAVFAAAGAELTWSAAAMIPAFYVAASVPTLGGIDAGANDGTVAGDAALNLVRGLAMVTPAAVVAWFAGFGAWPAFLVAGALVPVCYEVGKRTAWWTEVAGVKLEPGAPWSEVYVGAVLGLAAVVVGAS